MNTKHAMDPLTQRVVQTLRTNAISKIWFTASNLYVAAFKYRYVADCIENGTVKVRVGQLPPNWAAAYRHGKISDPAFVVLSDSIGTGPNAAEGLATLVHEATHACFDVSMGEMSIVSLENEFAGYLAQMVFTRACARADDRGAINLERKNSGGAMFKILSPLVDSILAAEKTMFVVPPAAIASAMPYLKAGYPNRPDRETMMGYSAPKLPPMSPVPGP